jgi:isoleucyl-tRNA synthetase
VRRSRRRFWDGDPAAFATLHDANEKLTLVLAPIAPFITVRVWHDVVASTNDGVPRSVHLADWPASDAAVIDTDLEQHVAQTRRLVELGRAARAESGVRTRQPLGRALVAGNGWDQVPAQLQAQLAEELNVQSVDSLSEVGEDLVQVSAKANFRALGKRHGKLTPKVAAAISEADPAQLMGAIREHGRATVHVTTDDGGRDVDVLPDEVVLTETPRAGWAVQHAGGESIALDLTLTPELRELGAIREVVRLIQDARKSAGLDVADRITLRWHTSDIRDSSVDLASALQRHRDLVAAEVLATEVVHDSSLNDGHRLADNDLGLLAAVERTN